MNNKIWSHDEKCMIPKAKVDYATVTCRSRKCRAIQRKYLQTHYAGVGQCVILAKYCAACGEEL